jgi:hypothetical protein
VGYLPLNMKRRFFRGSKVSSKSREVHLLVLSAVKIYFKSFFAYTHTDFVQDYS